MTTDNSFRLPHRAEYSGSAGNQQATALGVCVAGSWGREKLGVKRKKPLFFSDELDA
jgi:hypothetical protein